MKIYYFVPYLPFKGGDNAFKRPPFWYGCIGDSLDHYGLDYYLFPLNLIIRLARWLYAQKKKTFNRG